MDPGSFTAHVRATDPKIDMQVFGEAALNCKSCRAKIEGQSLTWSCHGDMAASNGTISMKDGVLAISQDPNAPLVPMPVGMTPSPRPPPKIDMFVQPCGSKVVFHTTVPDPDKKPVTGCE